MHFTILDLDGCISDDAHRQHHLPNYAVYHSLCHLDEAHHHDLVREADQISAVIVLTGRCESQRQKTTDWLHDNYGITASKQWMRPEHLHVPAPQMKVERLIKEGIRPEEILRAYDDRSDVLVAYELWGVPAERLSLLTIPGSTLEPWPPDRARWRPVKTLSAADVLQEMADTFRERNAVYGNNYKMIGPMVQILFPDGVPPELVVSDQWHLFELMLVKLSRFAISNLSHTDSIHDAAVYGAMIESILGELNGKS